MIFAGNMQVPVQRPALVIHMRMRMSYVALYRKFRPQTFDEVRGQEQAVRTLRNQVRTGRLQHAYLFCGTRGTGKTSVAKILARAVNCEHPVNGNPCGHCKSCRAIQDGTSMNVIEIDAASNNGVDNIREIVDEVQYHPTEGNYRVYIIDEVHMLSPGAFNALLKTLEEPPEYVIFILATTEVAKIPVTILSRCQRYDFRRIDVDTITARMQELADREGAVCEEKALRFIARAADGSMRDALSLLDRCLAFYMGEELTYEKALKALGEADMTVYSRLTRFLNDGDAGSVLRLYGRQIAGGIETGQFVNDYIWYLRNLLIVSSTSSEDAAEIVDVSEETLRDLRAMSSEVDADTAMRFIRILSELQNRMRFATNRRVLTETALLTMAAPRTEERDDSVRERLHQLEEKMDEILAGGISIRADAGRLPVEDAFPEEKTRRDAEALPAAAPETLRELVLGWNEFVAGISGLALRNQLKKAGHLQVDRSLSEQKIYVEFESQGHTKGDLIADRLMADEEHREGTAAEIERQIEKKFGVHVDVEVHLPENRPADAKDVDIEETIQQNINMQVEIDDSEDDGSII